MKKVYLLGVIILVLLADMVYAQQAVDNCFDYLNAGDYQRAIESGKRAVSLYPQNVAAYFCLGRSYYRVGEFDLAFEEFKKAERLASSRSDLMYIYNWLGLVYQRKGDIDNALFYHERSLSLARDLGNTKLEATELNNIASIYHDKGELDKALDYYERSLRLHEDEKDKVATYNNIALIYYDKGDYQKAIEYLKKAIDLGERSGDYHGVAISMFNLGDIYRQVKDFDKSFSLLNDGLERIKRVGDKYWEAIGYASLGLLYRDKGDIRQAGNYLKQAYELFNSLGAKNKAGLVLLELLSLEAQKPKTLYAGVEIGSKGVKAMAVEISPADEEGFYNVRELFRRSINTSIISGVKERGEFQSEAIEETARAAKLLLDELMKIEGIKREEIVILGSSALFKVKNKDLLSQKVKEITGKELLYVDKEQEVLYGIIGSIPVRYRESSILIDIGSGNTKLGYLEQEPLRTVSIEIPYGTVSFTEGIKKTNRSGKIFQNQALKMAEEEIGKRLISESSRRPGLLNRRYVFMTGGIVWAMATILYPEKHDSFLRLSTNDIDRFYNMLLQKKDRIFDIDLSRIKDEEIKSRAGKQINAVKDTFSLENLIAGATILKTIANNLKLIGREIYFSKDGNWMWGYIIESAIEKAEEGGKK